MITAHCAVPKPVVQFQNSNCTYLCSSKNLGAHSCVSKNYNSTILRHFLEFLQTLRIIYTYSMPWSTPFSLSGGILINCTICAVPKLLLHKFVQFPKFVLRSCAVPKKDHCTTSAAPRKKSTALTHTHKNKNH